jgi:hypothetical protein
LIVNGKRSPAIPVFNSAEIGTVVRRCISHYERVSSEQVINANNVFARKAVDSKGLKIIWAG